MSSDKIDYDKILPNETGADEVSLDDISSDDISSGDISSDDISSEDISSEDISSEDISSEDISSEDISSEDISSEDISSDGISSKNEKTHTIKVNTENIIKNKQLNSKSFKANHISNDKSIKNIDKQYDFINENILDVSKNGDKLRLILLIIISGMIFGIVACISFLWAKPYLQTYFETNIGDNNNSDVILNNDETSTNENSSSEQITSNNSNHGDTQNTSNSVDEAVSEALNNYKPGVDNFAQTFGELKEVSKTADKYMTTVFVNSTKTDWYDEDDVNEAITSGIIISIEKNILILTDFDSIKESDDILVGLADGGRYRGEVLGKSKEIGIAILKVDGEDISTNTYNLIRAAEVINSDDVENGESVLLIGNPFGMDRFMAYGVFTSIANEVDICDGKLRLMTTDISSTGIMNGFMIDVNGRLVGMVVRSLEKAGMENIVTSINIYDLYGYLDLLANGKDLPYVGIIGQEVTKNVIENIDKEMPYGIYITNTYQGSPAYLQGIMNGDIMVSVNGKETLSIKQYMDIINKTQIGQNITIVVKRKGREGYKEITYNVKVDKR